MTTGLSQRCWRAWWEELTPTERAWWHDHAQRPFLTSEQAQVLRAEGLPVVAIPGQDPHSEQVLFPVDLADLLEQDTAHLNAFSALRGTRGVTAVLHEDQ